MIYHKKDYSLLQGIRVYIYTENVDIQSNTFNFLP